MTTAETKAAVLRQLKHDFLPLTDREDAVGFVFFHREDRFFVKLIQPRARVEGPESMEAIAACVARHTKNCVACGFAGGVPSGMQTAPGCDIILHVEYIDSTSTWTRAGEDTAWQDVTTRRSPFPPFMSPFRYTNLAPGVA